MLPAPDTDIATAQTAEAAGQAPYRRVLLKLSGEVFGGGSIGVDPNVAHSLAAQIATSCTKPPYIRRERGYLVFAKMSGSAIEPAVEFGGWT